MNDDNVVQGYALIVLLFENITFSKILSNIPFLKINFTYYYISVSSYKSFNII